MAYTDATKISSMFRRLTIAATGTVVTTSEADEFISEVDAEINAKLNRYYVTPITGVESLKIVGMISKFKVAHIIKTILEVDSQESDKVSQEVQTNLAHKADKLLEELLPQYNKTAGRWEEPKVPLPDAVSKSVAPDTASLFNSKTLTQTAAEKAPQFKKGGNNW